MYEEIGSATIRLFQIYLSIGTRYPMFNYFIKGIIMKMIIDGFIKFLEVVVKETPTDYDDMALEVVKMFLKKLTIYK